MNRITRQRARERLSDSIVLATCAAIRAELFAVNALYFNDPPNDQTLALLRRQRTQIADLWQTPGGYRDDEYNQIITYLDSVYPQHCQRVTPTGRESKTVRPARVQAVVTSLQDEALALRQRYDNSPPLQVLIDFRGQQRLRVHREWAVAGGVTYEELWRISSELEALYPDIPLATVLAPSDADIRESKSLALRVNEKLTADIQTLLYKRTIEVVEAEIAAVDSERLAVQQRRSTNDDGLRRLRTEQQARLMALLNVPGGICDMEYDHIAAYIDDVDTSQWSPRSNRSNRSPNRGKGRSRRGQYPYTRRKPYTILERSRTRRGSRI